MAQFLRKLKLKSQSDADLAYAASFVEVDLGKPRTSSLTSSARSGDLVHLAQKLDDVLADANTLSHFVQFMHSQDQAHLVKFWLHANSFRLGSQQLVLDGQASSNVATMFHDDALNIFSKYLAMDAQYPVGISDSIRAAVTNRLCPTTRVQSVDADCLLPASTFVYSILNRRYFPEFIKSTYYVKHLLEFLSQAHPPLDEMMRCDIGVSAMMMFMEERRGSDLLMFWLQCENYRFAREHNNDLNYPIEMQVAEAICIYEKYLSLEATHSIDLPMSEHTAVVNSISREGGPLSTCFVRAQQYALRLIEEKHYDEFLQSPRFELLVGDLRHTVACFVELPRFDDQRRAGSSNSTVSTPLPSTFSSMTVPLAHDNLSETSSNAESASMRNQQSPCDRSFNLVNIDELGRVVRNYDNSDIVKDEAPRLFTKLSHKIAGIKDDDDTADRLAALIISDVQTAVAKGNQLHSSKSLQLTD